MIIKEIDYLLAIYELGSISAAAERLFITQSALSRYLQSLEDRLGFKIFTREKNKLKTTQEGELYIRFAKRVSDERTIFLAEAEELRKKKSDIRVGIGLILDTIRFRDVMEEYMERYPNSNVFINSQRMLQAIPSVKSRDVGFYFGYCPDDVDSSDLAFMPIFQDELLVAVPRMHHAMKLVKPHPITNKPYIDLHMLQKEPFIIQNETCIIRRHIYQLFEDLNFHPNIITTTNSTYAALTLVSQGLGIALCAFSMMSDLQNIYYAAVDDGSHSIPDGVVYLRDKKFSQYEKAFIDIFTKYNKDNSIKKMSL